MSDAEDEVSDKREVEVSAIDYVGPHAASPELYEIAVTLRPGADATPARLSLLLGPAEARFLARMLTWKPPPITTKDSLLDEIERLQT